MLTLPSVLLATIAYEDFAFKLRHFEEYVKDGKQWYAALHNDMDVEMFHVWGSTPQEAFDALMVEAEGHIEMAQYGIGRDAEKRAENGA